MTHADLTNIGLNNNQNAQPAVGLAHSIPGIGNRQTQMYLIYDQCA